MSSFYQHSERLNWYFYLLLTKTFLSKGKTNHDLILTCVLDYSTKQLHLHWINLIGIETQWKAEGTTIRNYTTR